MSTSTPMKAARHLAALASGVGLVLSASCTPRVYSPPTRMMPLESVATAKEGEYIVALQGGAAGAVFGGELLGGAARVRFGVVEKAEVSVEGSTFFVLNDSPTRAYRGIHALRGGVKYRALPFLSTTFGLGGGASAGGGFFAPDVGLLVGYENPYLVPFLGIDGGVSVPLFPRNVDVSLPDEGPRTFFDRPKLTWLAGAHAGLRLPLSCEWSALVAAAFDYLLDGETPGGYLVVNAGLEYRFGAP